MIADEALNGDLLADLNAAQRDAVETVDRPVLVLAGAGSGKTRVITHKLAYLVACCGYPPESLLALTFTNKAAREMRHRAVRLLGERAERATIGTFHAVGLRVLRRHSSLAGLRPGFVVYDVADQEAVIKRVMIDNDVDPQRIRPAAIANLIEQFKRRGLGPEEVSAGDWVGESGRAQSANEHLAARLYPSYERRMSAMNAVDFGDLLWRVVKMFMSYPLLLADYQRRWRYVLVDEFQDTDEIQGRLIRMLVADSERGSGAGLTVVGDDDQSIYSWRGARIENILNFPNLFDSAHIVRLEQNYRSTGIILEAAGELIARNRKRHAKRLWTSTAPGEKLSLCLCQSDREEAARVAALVGSEGVATPLNEIAVLYRTNAQSRLFEEALGRESIPYRVVGGIRFFERAEVKDVLAYLRLLVNPKDDIAFARVVNKPKRGIGPVTVGRLLELAGARGVGAFEAIPTCASAIKRGETRLRDFHHMLTSVGALQSHATALEVVKALFDRSGYLSQYLSHAGEDVEAQGRHDNLMELVSSVAEFCERAQDPSLKAYLDEVALLTHLDTMTEEEQRVTLMTVHAAKGLEFEVAIVSGLEEGIFPHSNSRLDEGGVEEERRLFYVALTRARKRVFITFAQSRRHWDELAYQAPSRFLNELPAGLVAIAPGSLSFKMGAERRSRDVDGDPEGIVPEVIEPCEGLTLEEARGRRVRHSSFGIGTIVGGREDCVLVDFPHVGQRSIMIRYLELLNS